MNPVGLHNSWCLSISLFRKDLYLSIYTSLLTLHPNSIPIIYNLNSISIFSIYIINIIINYIRFSHIQM